MAIEQAAKPRVTSHVTAISNSPTSFQTKSLQIAFLFQLFQPQNIVLMGQFPNCEIKLCDLEVARVIQEGEFIREIIGTPDYVGKFKAHQHSELWQPCAGRLQNNHEMCT